MLPINVYFIWQYVWKYDGSPWDYEIDDARSHSLLLLLIDAQPVGFQQFLDSFLTHSHALNLLVNSEGDRD